MGRIYVLNGISIYLYSRDHNPPHIHAFYAEYEVLIAISNRMKIKGDMPKPQLREIMNWLEDKETRKKLIELFHELNPKTRRG